MKILAVGAALVFLSSFELMAQDQSSPTSGAATSTAGTPAPGRYTGNFNNIASSGRPMGMELVIANSTDGKISGDVILNEGFCRGEKRPFVGEVKAGRVEGRASGPARCTPDLTLSLEVRGNRLNGTMQGSNNYDVQLSR